MDNSCIVVLGSLFLSTTQIMKNKKSSRFPFAVMATFSLFISMFFVLNVAAVTAYPFSFEYKQPNGSMLTMRMMGDEKVRWAETVDHYSLLSNGTGGWEYAVLDNKGDMIPSGILATDPLNRSKSASNLLDITPKSLNFSKGQIQILIQLWEKNKSMEKAFTPSGNKNLVMILVSFTDKAFTRTQAEFNNLMNQAGFNLNGAQGSVKDYFLENSYGAFNVTTTVVGPYLLSQNMAYYGGNVSGSDQRPREMVTEAVNLANPAVNFANFDNDGDGSVDGVYVIYAGYGEEAGGGANCIWAHAWSIPTVNLDGVNINKYSCSCELRGNSGTNISTIGVICHEFGHVCGAPDYYDTDYGTGGQYDGTGSWDLMAGGSWNGISAAGDCPAHVNGYQKWLYGWAHPQLLNGAQSVTLNNSAQNDNFCYYTTTTANEFYYCENRQAIGFDRAVPGHGMVIYHVDQPYISGAGNAINAASHQGMYPVCANAAGNPTAVYGTINGGGCPFPGTGARTSFTDATTPYARSWAGINTAKPLTNIAEAGTVITFCYISCAPGDPINLTATAVSSSQINLAWQLNSSSDPVLIAVSPDAAFGTPADGTNYIAGNTIPGGDVVIYAGSATSFNHTGLNPQTQYYYKAWSKLAGTIYSTGTTADATTFCGAISTFPYTQDFENGGIMPSCWSEKIENGSLNWVFRAGSGSGSAATACTGSYNANFYEGAYNTVNVSKLISPPFDLSGAANPQISFWYFNRLWSPDQDVLKVYYKTSAGGAWTLLNTYNTDVSAWTQVTISLPNKSSDYYVAFEATENYGYGICIDDINLTSGGALPVVLSELKTDCKPDGVEMIWETASETNSKYYRIEKSENLESFYNIGSVAAAGNSNQIIEYRFTDYNATRNAYYRIVEVDLDGTEQVLSTFYPDCFFAEPSVEIYPCPASEKVTVKLSGYSGKISVDAIGVTGILYPLATLNDIPAATEQTISLSHLPTGVYTIRITSLETGKATYSRLIVD